MHRARLVWITLAACSSAPSAPTTPPTTTPPAAPIDAGGDQVHAPPDAGAPAAVATAPSWVFRYNTPARTETWTLQFAGGDAQLVVDDGKRPLRYLGTATEGVTISIAVATHTAKLSLDCKRTKRPLSTKCNDRKAKPIDVLDCYHPDFKEPMPFAETHGVEYVTSKDCTGYRLIAPAQ